MNQAREIKYSTQDIHEEDISEVVGVLRSSMLTQGPEVPKFESTFGEVVGSRNCVAVSSATAGLHLLCLALGVGSGDLVWTSSISFVASANCARYCGAELDFVDIDTESGNLSIDCLERKLISAELSGRLPKGLIVVHLSGLSVDMVEINRLAQKYGFFVIEDASHALGGEYGGELIGTCRYSDAVVFSFHPVKIITTGEGGMITTKDDQLVPVLQRLRSHGVTSDVDLFGPAAKEDLWNYQQVSLGYPYRLTDISAALGRSQLRRLSENLKKRESIALHYFSCLDSEKLILPPTRALLDSAWHLFVVRVVADKVSSSRNQLYQKLWERGIKVNLHYSPIYLHPYWASQGFERGYCPNSEVFFETALSLPMHAKLTDCDLRVITEAVNSLV